MLNKDNQSGEEDIDDEEYDDDDDDEYWDDEEDSVDSQDQVCGTNSWLEPHRNNIRASAH